MSFHVEQGKINFWKKYSVIFGGKNIKNVQNGNFSAKLPSSDENVGGLLALPTIIEKASDFTCKYYTHLENVPKNKHSSLLVCSYLSDKDIVFFKDWHLAFSSFKVEQGGRNFWKKIFGFTWQQKHEELFKQEV